MWLGLEIVVAGLPPLPWPICLKFWLGKCIEHFLGLISSQSRVPNLVVKYKLAVEIYVKCYNYHNFRLNSGSIYISNWTIKSWNNEKWSIYLCLGVCPIIAKNPFTDLPQIIFKNLGNVLSLDSPARNTSCRDLTI